MKTLFIIANVFVMTLFMFGQFFIFKFVKSPKVKANFGVSLSIAFALYFLFIIALVLKGLWVGNFKVLPLMLFIFIPFFIGKKVSYETLSLWSNVQLGVFALSLVYCLFLV